MTNPNQLTTPTQVPIEQQLNQPAGSLRKLGSTIATIALTVGIGEASAAIHHDGHAVKPGIHAEAPGQPGTVTPGQQEVAKTQTVVDVQTVLDTAGEVYAPDFANDPHAGELVDPNSVATVADKITERRGQGYTVTKVTIEGHASDEDDHVNDNGER